MISQQMSVDGIKVCITRKRIKNIYLRVKPPDGHVEVSAPVAASLSAIEGFVRSKLGWIERQQRAVSASKMRLADEASPAQKKEWRACVSAQVPALIAKWEPIMGVHAEKVTYRDMKSRWGSCQPSTAVIRINIRLALFPPECLEYVVVHELCHLLERGHGPRFHALMDAFMPDWRQRRAQLR